MTLENALLGALSAVTSVLVFLAKEFYNRLQKAEIVIEVLRKDIEKLERENGGMTARLDIFENCPKYTECPFRIKRIEEDK